MKKPDSGLYETGSQSGDCLMRVFVTGATGFIGTAVVQELLANGHQVIGLVRSDAGAKSVAATGAQTLRGDLTDLDSLKRGASDSDGVIHLGFIHDFSKFKENCEIDRRAIEVFGETLAGSNRPLVVTSGLAHLASGGHVATEEHNISREPSAYPRASEQAALELLKKSVKVSIIRLAPSVHGDGDKGFMAGFVTVLIGLAREKGVSAYVGNGLNRWPGIHRLDAGALFRLALEKGVAGAKYHGVENEGTTFKEIATAIGKKLNLPVVSLSPEEASKHFTWFVGFAAMDLSASNQLTRERLGWTPTQLGLIADLERATLSAESKY
jgi:nucleoside-diphosphate-sugar epimerase